MHYVHATVNPRRKITITKQKQAVASTPFYEGQNKSCGMCPPLGPKGIYLKVEKSSSDQSGNRHRQPSSSVGGRGDGGRRRLGSSRRLSGHGARSSTLGGDGRGHLGGSGSHGGRSGGVSGGGSSRGGASSGLSGGSSSLSGGRSGLGSRGRGGGGGDVGQGAVGGVDGVLLGDDLDTGGGRHRSALVVGAGGDGDHGGAHNVDDSGGSSDLGRRASIGTSSRRASARASARGSGTGSRVRRGGLGSSGTGSRSR